MRFSLFALISGLAALAIVSALPAENLQRGVPSMEVTEPTADGCCKAGGVKVCGGICHKRSSVPSEDVSEPTEDGCCKAGGVKVCGGICRKRSEVLVGAME